MYFGVLFFCIALIIALNLAFNFAWITLLNLLIAYAVVLLPSLFCAIVIRTLPRSWFNHKNKLYQTSKFERNVYLKIGIKKWKDKIPEFGQSVNFKKDKLSCPQNIDYLTRFLTETCYAEVLHSSCIVCALIAMFCVPNLFLTMTLPIAIVYSIYNIPSIIIQRYNRPRLEAQLTRLQKNLVIQQSEENLSTQNA